MMDIFFVCKYFYFPTAWLAERLSPAVPRDGWGWAGAAGQEGGPGLADQGDSANRIKSYAFLFNPVLTDLIRNDFSLTFLLWFLFLLTLWRTLHFFYDTIKPRARNATGYIWCLKFLFIYFSILDLYILNIPVTILTFPSISLTWNNPISHISACRFNSLHLYCRLEPSR